MFLKLNKANKINKNFLIINLALPARIMQLIFQVFQILHMLSILINKFFIDWAIFFLKRLQSLAGIIFLGAILGIPYISYASQVTQIGRYTTIVNKPTMAQINPLLAIAQYKFSPSVLTVGDAIKAILQNTSYQLVSDKDLSKVVRETLKKPLPITCRTVGPLAIKDILTVLIGKQVFTLVEDPLHRLVNFDVKPEIKKALRS